MTKAGLQFLGPRPRADIWESLIRSGINIKGVVDPTLKDGEGMGLMLDAARRSPGHIHIARVFPYDEDVGAACKAGASPEATARKWVARIAALANGDPALRSLWYETGPNEPGVEYYEWINAYVGWVIYFSEMENLQLIWGNFNTGTPDYPLWPRLVRAMSASIEANAICPYRVLLGLHEYGTIGAIPDPRSAHHVLRYYQPQIRELLARIPKVITELGDDPPYRGANAEEYLDHFRWYDKQVAADNTVLAWYAYCLPNQQNDWEHFALDNATGAGIIEDAWQARGSQKLPAHPLPPAPAPEPEPEPPTAPKPITLTNPGFEGNTIKVGADHIIPEGWEVWAIGGLAGTHTEIEHHPPNVHGGACSGRIWVDRRRVCGFYQVVEGVVPGVRYQFSIYGKAQARSNPVVDTPSDNPVAMIIGADPLGFTNPTDPAVVWGAHTDVRDQFVPLTCEVVARNTQLTLYIKMDAQADVRTDTYWDDATLTLIAPAPDETAPYAAVVSTGGDNLMLRAGKSTKSTVLAKMPSGSEIEVLYNEEGWSRVRYTLEGWASSQYLKRRE